MKKLLCLLCLAMVVCLGACSKEEENTPVDNDVDVLTNEIYEAEEDASALQIEIHNALCNALNGSDEEVIAKEVARNFVAEFYTLSNKKGSEDVGGLTYLPENAREDFKTYASIYAYGNYEKIVQEYGKKNLPTVKSVEVLESVSGVYTFTETIPADKTAGTSESKVSKDYNGYEVKVSVSFEKTKVSNVDPEINNLISEIKGVYDEIDSNIFKVIVKEHIKENSTMY